MPLTLDASLRSAFARHMPDTLPDNVTYAELDAAVNAAVNAYNAAMKRAVYADVFTDEIHLRYVDNNRMCPARYIYL
jgi:hypothetical protein